VRTKEEISEMTHQAPTDTGPWFDRFAKPTATDLAGAIPESTRGVVDLARQKLTQRSLKESVSWQGVAWRWAYGYAAKGEAPGIHIIPDPVNPRISARVCGEAVCQIPPSEIPRHAREALASCTRVGKTLWLESSLNSEAHFDDFCALLDMVSGAVSQGVSS